jgi:predicted DNA binding CopG/RHH family protein
VRPIQYFSEAYLRQAKKSSPTQIAEFLDEYIRLQEKPRSANPRMQLISIRIPVDLLAEIKRRASRENQPYQSWMKRVLREAVSGD